MASVPKLQPLATTAASRRAGYCHGVVAHGTREYVHGDAHTNGIESLWSMFKRGYMGTYHQMSKGASAPVRQRVHRSSQHPAVGHRRADGQRGGGDGRQAAPLHRPDRHPRTGRGHCGRALVNSHVPSFAVRVVVTRSTRAPPCAPSSIRASDSNVRWAAAFSMESRKSR